MLRRTTYEFVCGVDVADGSEDDVVTAKYMGLRDVDGWQRHSPWEGSAESRPKRATVSSIPACISTLSSTSSRLYTSASPATSVTTAFVGSRGVPPPSGDGRRAETQAFPEIALGMSEMDIVVLEERVREAGGTSKSLFASRFPFASANTFISQVASSLPYSSHYTFKVLSRCRSRSSCA